MQRYDASRAATRARQSDAAPSRQPMLRSRLRVAVVRVVAGVGTGFLVVPARVPACVPALAAVLAAALLALPRPVAAEASPPRETIELSAREREHLKAGMRAYLESIQGVIEGLAKHDFKAIARSAARSGMASVKDVSPALALRLPPQFTLMSVDTHERFDALAREARDMRETRSKLSVTSKLNDVLQNCTSCHAMFRF